MLWFAKLESVTSFQRRFRQEYRVRNTPNYKSIMLWYRTFEETGFKMPHTGGRLRNLETEAAISAAMMASPQLQQDNSMDIVFQQDGAPPHWATGVRDYLDDTFGDQLCGLQILQTSLHLTFFFGVL